MLVNSVFQYLSINKDLILKINSEWLFNKQFLNGKSLKMVCLLLYDLGFLSNLYIQCSHLLAFVN